MKSNVLTYKDWYRLNEGWFSDILGIEDKIPDDEIEKFTCEDCGEYDYDMYMVNNDIWQKYGNEGLTLCNSCLENRMNRKLRREDVSNYSDVGANKANTYIQNLLK